MSILPKACANVEDHLAAVVRASYHAHLVDVIQKVWKGIFQSGAVNILNEMLAQLVYLTGLSGRYLSKVWCSIEHMQLSTRRNIIYQLIQEMSLERGHQG